MNPKTKHQVGQVVRFQPLIERVDHLSAHSDPTSIPCKVVEVHIEPGKVLYDLALPDPGAPGGFYEAYPLRRVDSALVGLPPVAVEGYQERVILEAFELGLNMSKLGAFIAGGHTGGPFCTLSPDEQSRLHRQHSAQITLHDVLTERIYAFTVAAKQAEKSPAEPGFSLDDDKPLEGPSCGLGTGGADCEACQ